MSGLIDSKSLVLFLPLALRRVYTQSDGFLVRDADATGHNNLVIDAVNARSCGQWFFCASTIEEDHEGSEVGEGEEVLGFFLVAGCDSAVMLQLGPEAFDQVAIFVSRPIRFSRRFRVGPTADHRFGTWSFDGRHNRLRIVPLVRDDHFQRQTLDQRWGLRHVGGLTAGQN